MPSYLGVAQFVHRFKDPVPDPVVKETPQQRRAAKIKRKLEHSGERVKRQTAKWDPKAISEDKVTKDAYKTLFVGRLAFDVTEDDLKNEFEYYGDIVSVKLVRNQKTGKSRGYAFAEFKSSRDLKEAYKDADGRKINGRRILVDVERGRTVKGWKPRRLAGGLGATRAGGKDVCQKYSGREPPAGSSSSSSSRRGGSRDRDRRGGGGDRDRRGGGGDRDRRGGGDRGDRDRRGDRRSRDRERERRKD